MKEQIEKLEAEVGLIHPDDTCLRAVRLSKADDEEQGAASSQAVANAIGYAKHFSRSHDAVIRVYDAAGNVIETHEHKGGFKP